MPQLREWKKFIHAIDRRRDIIVPGDKQKTLQFCVEAFVETAQEAIDQKGSFFVALSGGSTPKEIYHSLTQSPFINALDWSKIHFFWSDERCVPPNDPNSNYHMAMEAGLRALPIVPEQLHRMPAEGDIEKGAQQYEALIRKWVPNLSFDLVLLGMGGDGHTASLFPETHALHPHEERLVIENFIPQKDTWRMSFTFHLINLAKQIHIYVIGSQKADIVYQVLKGEFDPDELPIQQVGSEEHKALWILDNDAAELLD